MPVADYPPARLARAADAARIAAYGGSILASLTWAALGQSGKDHWLKVAAAVLDEDAKQEVKDVVLFD